MSLSRSGILRTASALLFSLALAAIVLLGSGSDGERDSASTPFVGMDGHALFSRACASCHGGDLLGTDQGPPFLDAAYRPGHHADAAFLLAVRRGVRSHHWHFGDMPAVEGLTDEQVSAIVEFVRAEQRAAGID